MTFTLHESLGADETRMNEASAYLPSCVVQPFPIIPMLVTQPKLSFRMNSRFLTSASRRTAQNARIERDCIRSCLKRIVPSDTGSSGNHLDWKGGLYE